MASKSPKRDGDDSPRADLDARTLAFIDSIASRVREAIARGELPTIDILVRSLSNVSYDPEKGYLELGADPQIADADRQHDPLLRADAPAPGHIARDGSEQRLRHETRSLLRQQELGGLSLR